MAAATVKSCNRIACLLRESVAIFQSQRELKPPENRPHRSVVVRMSAVPMIEQRGDFGEYDADLAGHGRQNRPAGDCYRRSQQRVLDQILSPIPVQQPQQPNGNSVSGALHRLARSLFAFWMMMKDASGRDKRVLPVVEWRKHPRG